MCRFASGQATELRREYRVPDLCRRGALASLPDGDDGRVLPRSSGSVEAGRFAQDSLTSTPSSLNASNTVDSRCCPPIKFGGLETAVMYNSASEPYLSTARRTER